MNRTTLPIHEIIVQDRQRELNQVHVASLAESIKTLGLIQPIVINQEKRLIAGGHRLAACSQLGFETIDVVFKETLSEYELQELELTENLKRSDLTWQEEVKAIAKIHALKRRSAALDSKTWGQVETGKLLGVSQGAVSYAIIISRHLEDNDKEITEAENPSEAWSILMRRDQQLAEAELAQRHIASSQSMIFTDDEDETFNFSDGARPSDISSVEPIPQGKRLLGYNKELPPENFQDKCGACFGKKVDESFEECERCKGTGIQWAVSSPRSNLAIVLKPIYVDIESITIDLTSHYIHSDSIPFMWSKPETFDHIITDIPYGIDIENIDQSNSINDISTIKAEHTVEGNKELFKQFFPAALNCLKPNAYLITFCDQMLWQEMYDLAISAGFKVQRWPFIWVKDYPCLNQMAQTNFTKSVEIAMVCRKGVITLPEKQSTNYIITGRDELCTKHPFAKPFALWERLIRAVSIENQYILDPFCGSGSAFISGVRLGRHMVGVEKDTALYNSGLENLKQFYLGLNPKTNFK